MPSSLVSSQVGPFFYLNSLYYSFFFCYGATPLTYLLLGGSLAVRGGAKAMRNNAIGCAILLAVIEGVGIGFQRMMAENMKLEAPVPPPQQQPALAE